MTKRQEIKINTKWRYKNCNQKLIVVIHAVGTCSTGSTRFKFVEYGLLTAKAAHVSQSIKGFREYYELEQK